MAGAQSQGEAKSASEVIPLYTSMLSLCVTLPQGLLTAPWAESMFLAFAGEVRKQAQSRSAQESVVYKTWSHPWLSKLATCGWLLVTHMSGSSAPWFRSCKMMGDIR